MMLHRHFEAEKNDNITTLKDVTPGAKDEYVSDIFPPDEKKENDPPKRTRRKKSEEQ